MRSYMSISLNLTNDMFEPRAVDRCADSVYLIAHLSMPSQREREAKPYPTLPTRYVDNEFNSSVLSPFVKDRWSPFSNKHSVKIRNNTGRYSLTSLPRT